MAPPLPPNLPPELLARKQAAEVAQAEATLRTQEAKLAADARVAEALAKQGIAEAEQKAAEARQARFKALIPDLGAVRPSGLDQKEGPPMGAVPLTFGALGGLGSAVAARLAEAFGGATVRVLLTADADLATADAVYQDVMTGVSQLQLASDALLPQAGPQPMAHAASVPAVLPAVAGALAGALPGMLSLFSAQRTLSGAAVTVSDLAAGLAVAGRLKANTKWGNISLVHDDFRLLADSVVYDHASRLATQRERLHAEKRRVEAVARGKTAELTAQQVEVGQATLALSTAPEGERPALSAKLKEARRTVEVLTGEIDDATLRAGELESVAAGIDGFLAAVRTVPAGGRRSPLATAALCEQLHARGPESFTHVLLVKSQSGQAQQLVENRPLWFQDKFSTVVDVSLVYLLIETGESSIVAAGSATSTARAFGKIGDVPEVRVDAPTV